MNIFYLSHNPVEAARFMVNKHIGKMLVESCQMLSTAHHVLDEGLLLPHGIYKAAYINHPCSKWVRESRANYFWLHDHARELSVEFMGRFGKRHKSDTVLDRLILAPFNMPTTGEFTNPPLCMPDEYKINPSDPVACYREYYKKGKAHLHRWTNREIPQWIKE